MVESPPESPDEGTPRNDFAIASVIFGIVSLVFRFLGLLPLGAIVCGVIGLVRARACGGKGRILSSIGILLGIAFLLLRLYETGVFGPV